MFRTSLTGVNAASRDLSVISNNLANAMTVGFKRSISAFADVAASSAESRPGAQAGQGVVIQDVRRSLQAGALESTGKSLDLAIVGSGYFVYGDPQAQPGGEPQVSFSRAGQVTLNAAGQIVDASGAPLLGLPISAKGATGSTPVPIDLGKATGGDLTKLHAIAIDAQGVLTATMSDGRTQKVAAIATALFRNEQGLRAAGGSRLNETDQSGPPDYTPAGRNGAGEIRQGAVETANVDLTAEMMRMIQAQQAYNGNARAMQTTSEMLRSAADTLVR